MIIRGAAGKKSPLGERVKGNDSIYFVEEGGDMTVTHRGVVGQVNEQYKLSP